MDDGGFIDSTAELSGIKQLFYPPADHFIPSLQRYISLEHGLIAKKHQAVRTAIFNRPDDGSTLHIFSNIQYISFHFNKTK